MACFQLPRLLTSLIRPLSILIIVIIFCSNALAQGSVPDDIYWNGSFFLSGLDFSSGYSRTSLIEFEGDLIIGGPVERIDGLDVYNIAAWDGASWRPMGREEDTAVTDFEIYNGQLYAAVRGDAYWGVLKREGDTWVPLGDNMLVHSLAVFDGKLIAGGEFSDADGVPVNNVAAWDGVGWDSLGGGLSGFYYFEQVSDMVVYDGELIVAGEFSEAGGIVCKNIARWDGVSWDSIGSGILGEEYSSTHVSCLAIYDSDLFVGGEFSVVDGNVSENLAVWNGASWEPFVCDLQDFAEISAMTVYDSGLVIAGTINGDVVNPGAAMRSWNGTICTPFAEWPDGWVTALAVYNGDLIVSGNFFAVGSVGYNGIARWDGSTWNKMSLRDGLGLPLLSDNGPNAMATHNGKLFVAGDFAGAGDIASRDLVSWDGNQWEAIGVGRDTLVSVLFESSFGLVVAGMIFDYHDLVGPYDGYPLLMIYDDIGDIKTALFDVAQISYDTSGSEPPYDIRVTSVCEYDGELIAAFSNPVDLDGVPLGGLAKWNGNSWSPFPDPVTSRVDHLIVNDSLLIALIADPLVDPSIQLISTWNGTQWTSLDFIYGVNSVAIYNGDLIFSGSFYSPDPPAVNNILRYNMDSLEWHTLDDGVGDQSSIAYGMTVYNDRLIVSGSFEQASGVSAKKIAAWDGNTWSALGSGVGAKNDEMALAVYGDNLVVCGEFHTAGEKASSGIAFWNDGTGDCCIGDRGNANGDPEDKVNVTDITYLINWLFGVPSGTPPSCLAEANTNGDPEEKVNITDITYLIQYLFGVPTGPAPSSCP